MKNIKCRMEVKWVMNYFEMKKDLRDREKSGQKFITGKKELEEIENKEKK